MKSAWWTTVESSCDDGGFPCAYTLAFTSHILLDLTDICSLFRSHDICLVVYTLSGHRELLLQILECKYYQE
ncbi:unnamed protein product [Victoria cruziana]